MKRQQQRTPTLVSQQDSSQPVKGNFAARATDTLNVSPSSGGPSKTGPETLEFEATNFTLLQANVGNNRGFLLTRGELEGHLALVNPAPTFVGLIETLLNKSAADGQVQLAGYHLVSRRDRRDGRKGGGVALFVKEEHRACVNLLKHSDNSERSWYLVHTAQGPLLLGLWYRPPNKGEVASVEGCREEYDELEEDALGCLLVGDLNVHNEAWLKHSTGTSLEGKALQNFCEENGFEEKVKKPTRDKHLLDLVLTNLGKGVTAKVLPKLEDHSLVQATVALGVPTEQKEERERWLYKKADWKGLKKTLANTDWSFLDHTQDSDEAQATLTEKVLSAARKHIPVSTEPATRKTHPWLNDRCLKLVAAKRAAEGTDEYRKKLKECSRGVLEEYNKYVHRLREELRKLPRCSKKWCKLAKSVTSGEALRGSVPPLKNKAGEWVTTAKGKCNLLKETLTEKYVLASGELNEFSTLAQDWPLGVSGFLPVRKRNVVKQLRQLNEDKATGPDYLSTRILRQCAEELGLPVAKLTRIVLNSGKWPTAWREHWVVPLYKKKAVWDPTNYRGVHLTAQLSKVVERVLGRYWQPYLEATEAYGPNQFAYTTKRGCKDLLLLNQLDWLWNLHLGRKVALYCSDVKGAFDRVDSERLKLKLRQKGLGGQLLEVVGDWLEERTAKVVVEGEHSETAVLRDSVYQGTVWGPPLWNVFFEDARLAVNQAGYKEALFADDLNAYKDYAGKLSNEVLMEEMSDCQATLHKWGRANKVQFDAGKESMHILHQRKPEGDGFEMFGVKFDTKLRMELQVQSLVNRCRWKLKTLLRTRRYFTEEQLVQQYKMHILPFLEFCTPAVYHATATALAPLNKLQTTFLKELGLTPLEALRKYKLAPLETRRDIALLGVVHRTVLKQGPPQFQRWFRPAECTSFSLSLSLSLSLSISVSLFSLSLSLSPSISVSLLLSLSLSLSLSSSLPPSLPSSLPFSFRHSKSV